MDINNYTDEHILNVYERYCEDNNYYECILYPIHTIEDDYGYAVQEFIFKNTDIPKKYSYYKIDELDSEKVKWYTEKEAIEEAKNVMKEHLDYLEEEY